MNEYALSQIERLRSVCEQLKPLVVIRCITYNQERYIRDTLDGFVMQQSDFPVIAFVHDDASSDSTADILREYSQKYPDLIFPIFEKENQHSKKDGSLDNILADAVNATGAKYIAYCEGDDYWTDPLKIQKQVDYMESHPECSMCFTNAQWLDAKTGQILKLANDFGQNQDMSMYDLIMKGGGLCTTASIVVRSDKYKQIALNISDLYVGDYCIQVMMGYLGLVHYINDVTSVYRVNSVGSWTSTEEKTKFEYRRNLIWPKHKHLVERLDLLTNGKYSKLFTWSMYELMFYDCLRYKKYFRALCVWPKLETPFKRHGFKTFLRISGYGYIRDLLKNVFN